MNSLAIRPANMSQQCFYFQKLAYGLTDGAKRVYHANKEEGRHVTETKL